MKNFFADKLEVSIYETRAEMGRAAAADVAEAIQKVLEKKDFCNMIFAAAPSQNEVLEALLSHPAVDFTRINAFHMDEYCGLPADAPQGFGNFLKNAIFGHAPFHSVNYLNGNNPDIDTECTRYQKLLEENPIDIVCLGIGENGHIAFNDPWVADFQDPATVKKVPLDQVCRQQQVNDGCFASLDQVPTTALTLTIPTLFAGKELFCVVPATTKAKAVYETVTGPVSIDCPASILRTHEAAKLYLDSDSGKLI